MNSIHMILCLQLTLRKPVHSKVYEDISNYRYDHSVCLSVCLCMCYSRQRRCTRKGGCPASPLVTIEGGQGPALGPPGRLSTCLMGSEGVLALAVRVVILLWVSAPWIGEMGEINESQYTKTACNIMSVSMLKKKDCLDICTCSNPTNYI